MDCFRDCTSAHKLLKAAEEIVQSSNFFADTDVAGCWDITNLLFFPEETPILVSGEPKALVAVVSLILNICS